MHTENDLKTYKEQVIKTKALGRDSIIKLATQSVNDNSEVIINDDKILKSVWYNKISVKVEFKIFYPIVYLPYNTEYFYETTVNVIGSKVIGKGGTTISNISNKNLEDFFNTKLYYHTKEKESKVKAVIKLNNTNDEKYYLDKEKLQRVIIKEQKEYYILQLGYSYPITYKIDKITGKIYDYEDPYSGLYITPAQPPIRENPVEGKWIEMKE